MAATILSRSLRSLETFSSLPTIEKGAIAMRRSNIQDGRDNIGTDGFPVLQPAGGLLAGLRNEVFVAMLGRCRYKRGTQKSVVITIALLRRHSEAPARSIEHGQHEAIVIGLSVRARRYSLRARRSATRPL